MQKCSKLTVINDMSFMLQKDVLQIKNPLLLNLTAHKKSLVETTGVPVNILVFSSGFLVTLTKEQY